MSGNLGYTKKFIILKKDFSNMVDLSPKGHGKIEIKGIKGNISLSLENAEGDQFYNVLLIDRNKSYDLGKIYTEKNGKGREEIVFNLQDLESKGFQINRLNGVVISRDANVLLGGYMDKEDGSIERFVKDLEIKEEPIEEIIEKVEFIQDEPVFVATKIDEPIVGETIIEEIISEEPIVEEFIAQEIMVEEVIPDDPIEELIVEEPEILEILAEDIFIEDSVVIPLDDSVEIKDEDVRIESDFKFEYVKEIVIEKTIEPEDDFEPIFEPILELSQETELVAEEIIEPISEDLPQLEESNEEVVDIKDFDYDLNRRVVQKNQTTNYVLNILRYFPYIDPFKINLKGYNWWKIDFQDEAKGFLPYFSYLIGGDQKSRRIDNNVSARELMSIYSHYLFGLYNLADDVKYYVYGVPGGFYKDEHPHGGITGFNTWFAGNEGGGYWLLYIDPLTGSIIYPINPMIPTD